MRNDFIRWVRGGKSVWMGSDERGRLKHSIGGGAASALWERSFNFRQKPDFKG